MRKQKQVGCCSPPESTRFKPGQSGNPKGLPKGSRNLATDLGAFVHGAFTALHPGQPLTPNWHIDALCVCIQQMVNGSGPGRLVVNLPPRSLKSFVISVAFPAWMLGRDPSCHLICASYGDDL